MLIYQLLSKKLEFIACVTVLIVAFLHVTASYISLYEIVWWFDIPMHLGGGFFVGSYVLSVFFGKKYFVDYTKNELTIIAFPLLVTLCVALGWEVFEYAFRAGGNPYFSYAFDTGKDIVNGLVGSLCASVAVLTISRKNAYFLNRKNT
jgi:hypothetical protein